MSQILLPPSSQEPQSSAAIAPEQQSPPPPPVYTPEPLKRPSRFWRVVKWPIRQLLKGIYLLGSLINRHRIISLIALVVIAAMVTGGVLTYRALNPDPKPSNGTTSGNVTIPDAPFTVVNGSQTPLSNGVLLWLHGTKTYNAQEVWGSMSQGLHAAYAQRGVTQDDFQKLLDGWRTNGLKFDQFIVAGSFIFPNGTATYTIEVVVHENQQSDILTWYFRTDPSGQILSVRDITQL